MKNFSIITNVVKDDNLTVTHSITNYIEKKGGYATLLSTYEGRNRILMPVRFQSIQSVSLFWEETVH